MRQSIHCRIVVSLVAGLTGVVMAMTARMASANSQDQGPPILTYSEPDDPVVEILHETTGRIFSDNPKDYTKAVNEHGLRKIDEAIVTRPDDPRLHWCRHLTLNRLDRNTEARVSLEEAIRLARLIPGGTDLLETYYAEHALACVKEGDTAAAAAAFLARLDTDPVKSPFHYTTLVIYLPEEFKADAVVPGPGPLFPDRARLEAFWGPLEQFIATYSSTANIAKLKRVTDKVRVGMDYREVARAVGFPDYSAGWCHWDHGIPLMDACWEYQSQEPNIVHEGNLIGAIPPTNTDVVHVVIVDKQVVKISRTRGLAPDKMHFKHGERASFDIDNELLSGVALSPDGTLVAAGDINGKVHMLDIRDGRKHLVLQVPGVKEGEYRGWLKPIVFAPDGKILAAGGLFDGTVRLWDVANGGLLSTLQVLPVPKDSGQSDHVESVAFAPDGKTLATVGYDQYVRLWDVATGQLRASLRGHSFNVSAIAYSPDGKTLASGDQYGNIRLWDVASGQPRAHWPGYFPTVRALAFSPDGKTLAVARENQSVVQLRDLTTDRWRTGIPRGNPQGSQSLAFSPDSKVLAVAGTWDVATLWNPATAQLIGILEGHARYPDAVVFSTDGKMLATVQGKTVKLWDAPKSIDPVQPVKP